MTSFSLPSLPTQDDLNARFQTLNTTLQGLLKDDLGQYQLIKGAAVVATTPSIRVVPPVLDTQFKMTPKSGIECIISRAVDMATDEMMNNLAAIYETYTLQLRQFDPNKSTQLAVTKIVTSNQFVIFDSPRIIPYTELSSGIAYELAVIRLTLGNWYYRH
jgi:hypothetical protein